MLTPHREDELEALLLRLAPESAKRWKPATPGQIAELEGLVARPLPPFYQWYLARMGQDSGRIVQPYVDFSVARVLELYRDGEVSRDDRRLLIGVDEDDLSQAHVFYALDKPTRDDCPIGYKGLEDDQLLAQYYETFRELIAWGAFFRWRVRSFEHQCVGRALTDDGDPIAPRFKQAMEAAGFAQPVAGGDYFGIFERADAAMAASGTLDLGPHRIGFSFGATSVAALRRTLGELGMDTGLSITVDEWSSGTK